MSIYIISHNVIKIYHQNEIKHLVIIKKEIKHLVCSVMANFAPRRHLGFEKYIITMLG